MSLWQYMHFFSYISLYSFLSDLRLFYGHPCLPSSIQPPYPPPPHPPTHTRSCSAGAHCGPGSHGVPVCPITGFMDCLSLRGVTDGVTFQTYRYALVTLRHCPGVCKTVYHVHRGRHRPVTDDYGSGGESLGRLRSCSQDKGLVQFEREINISEISKPAYH